MEILEQISKENHHVEAIRETLITAVKMPLFTNHSEFTNPDNFGIYRNTGGKPLGVVGNVYNPPNLNLLLDSIVLSVAECNSDLDISKLTYTELKDGAKVKFSIPIKDYQIKSPLKGDILKTTIDFFTGFDGLTANELNISSLRLVCTNGAKHWQKAISFKFKNTIGNLDKPALMCNEIIKAIANSDKYVENLNELVKIPVTLEQRNLFISKLTGYNVQEFKDLTTRKQNIINSIQNSIATEIETTGSTMFSLLQGITRYTTHELAGGRLEDVLFDNAAKLNQTAHQLVMVNREQFMN